MHITTPRGDRPQPDLSPWGVPWPSDDDLRLDADTAWAIEVGWADPGSTDLSFSDSGSADSGSADSGSADSGFADSGSADSGFAGSGSAGSGSAGSGSAGSGFADSGWVGSGSAGSGCTGSGASGVEVVDVLHPGSPGGGGSPGRARPTEGPKERDDTAACGPGPGCEAPPESAVATPGQLLHELEREVRERHRATAAEYRLIRLLLEGAAADPVPWVGADPTLDLEWNDPRGRTVAAVRRDRRDVAERAAVAEIATRLRLSEQTVRVRAAHAGVLQARCPDVWSAFAEGSISERHAIESARLAMSLPETDAVTTAESGAATDSAGFVGGEAVAEASRGEDGAPDASLVTPADDNGPAGPIDPADPTAPGDPARPVLGSDEHESWRAFDEGALDRALRLPPARFAVAARSLRERVHGESIETRHRRAARDRGVWLTAELDGMATLSALLPADRAHAAMARVDRAARHLCSASDEDRTLAQLRADAFADLLSAAPPSVSPVPAAPRPTAPVNQTPAAAAPKRPAAIVVTVPALTLLGAGTEPAVLDGYGPIDLDTARRLAGGATSWIRVLTHPVTGVPLTLDRTTYRVPTALRRWLGVVSPTCVFPGCGRSARECDLDHLTAWIDGGATDDDNLAPECRRHHRLRHESRWHPSRDPDTGDLRWTSPLGAHIAEDPPPF